MDWIKGLVLNSQKVINYDRHLKSMSGNNNDNFQWFRSTCVYVSWKFDTHISFLSQGGEYQTTLKDYKRQLIAEESQRVYQLKHFDQNTKYEDNNPKFNKKILAKKIWLILYGGAENYSA